MVKQHQPALRQALEDRDLAPMASVGSSRRRCTAGQVGLRRTRRATTWTATKLVGADSVPGGAVADGLLRA